MDNNTFKSVAFGGFDKQDVIAYIQRTAQETAAAQDALRKENDDLRVENESLSSQLATLRYQLETLRSEHEQLKGEAALDDALRQELEVLRPQAERLAREDIRTDNVYNCALDIMKFLDRQAEYDLDAENNPSDTDFVEYFLFDSHK